MSNIKNIVEEMDTSSPRNHQSVAVSKSNVLTPRNKMSLLLDLPMETASTEHSGSLSASASAASYNSAQPMTETKTERDAKLKAFFSSTDATDEAIDYTNNPQGRFLNVQNFLTNQRIENE